MVYAIDIYNNAELAQAAYADLAVGPTDSDNNLSALQLDDTGGSRMSQTQATEFASRYTEVVAVYSDPATDFQATVFKSADGKLTLACRGTAGSADLLEDVTTIAPYGCAYNQIVSMYNWWQRVTNTSANNVAQYDVQLISLLETPPAGSVFLHTVPNPLLPDVLVSKYLVPIGSVPGESAANPELTAALSIDPLVDVTGHSLGGHLAMAFASLFNAGEVTVFNAPGFRSDALSNNEDFFNALGGSIPNGVNTTNIIAANDGTDQSSWSPIAGLWSRPGADVDISIEDQVFQMNRLNQALATTAK